MEEVNYIPTVQEAIDNVSSDTIMAASSQTAAITGDLQTAVERHRPAPQYIRRQPTLYREHKVGRNDKCPCGSGKKYKDCCLESGRFEGYTMQRVS